MTDIFDCPVPKCGELLEISTRQALFVAPKEPYKKWARLYNNESEAELFDRLNENHVYLIDIPVTGNLKYEVLPYYQKIFENELECWNSIKKEWPENRSINAFFDWFDVRLCDWVYDFGEDEIEKEDVY